MYTTFFDERDMYTTCQSHSRHINVYKISRHVSTKKNKMHIFVYYFMVNIYLLNFISCYLLLKSDILKRNGGLKMSMIMRFHLFNLYSKILNFIFKLIYKISLKIYIA
jgi:hypothetical protein